ncbi:hypothetical protein K456DRAFT_1730761 [Colletotrichum gloeosporioides 23]|nr:hypothetical protein K456DRAFT_1730761 [Colletotrichum gloeosporioides 23]
MPRCCSSNTASSVSKSVSHLRALICPFYSVSDFVPEAAIYSSSSPGLDFPYPHRINSIDPNNTNAAYWSEEDYSEDEPEEGDDEDIRNEPKRDDDGDEPTTDAPEDEPETDGPEEEPRDAQAGQDEAFQRRPSDARNDPPEMQRTRFR